MKPMKWIAGLSLAALASVGVARADEDCEARVSDWQPRSAVVRMAEARGWSVEAIRVDDGCYQIRATDAQGQRLRAKVDPVTLDIVKLKTRGEGERHGRGAHEEDGERRRHGRHGRERGGDDDEAGAQATPPSGVVPNAAPATDPEPGLIGKPKAEIR